MNSNGILERQVVTVFPETPTTLGEMNELRSQLAEKSREAGYAFLWDTFHAPRQVVELRKALRALDIQPFSPASVERYKNQAQKKLNRKATFVGLIGCGFLLLIPFFAGGVIWYGNDLLMLGYLASAIIGLLTLMLGRDMRWNWQLVYLVRYRKPVPEFVLETACRINGSMPRARLYIEELVRGPEVKDPFLVVQVGTPDTVQETYYIEVFEEPRFERFEGIG